LDCTRKKCHHDARPPCSWWTAESKTKNVSGKLIVHGGLSPFDSPLTLYHDHYNIAQEAVH